MIVRDIFKKYKLNIKDNKKVMTTTLKKFS